MSQTIRYITHPQVLIDPDLDIQKWSLNETGRSRIKALAASGALKGTGSVFSSAETKAVQTATPLAKGLGCDLTIRVGMHENDRSSTGFLPGDQFETAADHFFAHPEVSFQGWETAVAAQKRIVSEFFDCLRLAPEGDILIVGHGAVGTLLYCHLAKLPISRTHDQVAGGGSYFQLGDINRGVITGWRLIEMLPAGTRRKSLEG